MSVLAGVVGLQVVQVLQLELVVVVEVWIESARASLIYWKMFVMLFDSDVVLKKVKHISVMVL